MAIIAAAVGAWLFAIAALYSLQDRFIYPVQPTRVQAPLGLEAVRYPTSDGLTLEAGYAAPQDGKPLLIFFHGNGDQWRNAGDLFRPLLAEGYGLLATEYRGYSGNPGAPSEEGLYRDGRAAVDFAMRAGVAPEAAILVGNSLGSGVATQLASERAFAALVLVSPFDSLVDTAARKLRWAPTRPLLRDRFDNVAKLSSTRQPTLILHAEDDTLIAVDQAQRLAGSRKGITFETTVGRGHGLMYDPAVMARIDRFAREDASLD